jgi:hypothetical protein
MKKSVFLVIIILMISPFITQFNAISCDLLYFCAEYTEDEEEIDCGDRFYVGNVNIMVNLESAIYYTTVRIQLDKFDPRSNEFAYFEDYEFDVESDMDYINFGKIYFGEKGFYRVFLLDPYDETITSALVEII